MKPNPGSDEAREQGCTCPVLDNAFGCGSMGTSGEDAVFWYDEKCPLHFSGYHAAIAREPIPELIQMEISCEV